MGMITFQDIDGTQVTWDESQGVWPAEPDLYSPELVAELDEMIEEEDAH